MAALALFSAFVIAISSVGLILYSTRPPSSLIDGLLLLLSELMLLERSSSAWTAISQFLPAPVSASSSAFLVFLVFFWRRPRVLTGLFTPWLETIRLLDRGLRPFAGEPSAFSRASSCSELTLSVRLLPMSVSGYSPPALDVTSIAENPGELAGPRENPPVFLDTFVV